MATAKQMMTLSSEQSDFEKKKGKLIRMKALHNDDEFPADITSIWRDGNLENAFGDLDPTAYVEWKRVKEITDFPEFLERVGSDGENNYDLNQGFLDTSWLLSVACGVAAVSQETFMKVVPPGQGFDKQNYCGMFRFNFRRDGAWVEVVVDDFLPVDAGGQLLFCRNAGSPDVMWPALMEKAYAKFKGGYHKLYGCSSRACLADLTSGVPPSRISLADKEILDPDLFFQLRVQRRQVLMCANILVEVARETKVAVTRQEYIIVGFAEVRDFKRKKHKLIGLLNPHRKTEWNQWLNKPSESRILPEEITEELADRNKAGGEFWLLFDDFVHHFGSIDVCHFDQSTIKAPPTCFGLQMSPGRPMMALVAALTLGNVLYDAIFSK